MLISKQQSPLILIVDDDPLIQNLLENLLKKEGYRVTLAAEGMEAIKEFQRCKPDLVLMDAAMPIMDGFTACSKLKELEVNTDIPIIMITSLDDEKSVNQAFQAGAIEYITKPIHWAVLRNRVNVIIKAQSTKIALENIQNILTNNIDCKHELN
jgi:PleD family two-component response regulator